MASSVEFGVVDVETTGPLPERYDRIIEIAVVRTDRRGRIIDEYCSLVNPDRDVGSTRIHGITAGDLKKAPSFGDIVGDVVSRLAGAVFVAHNVYFDQRFVCSELSRADYRAPALCTLCTMALSRRVNPQIPSRRLGSICECFGIPFTNGHTAQADATAAASVLAHCLSKLTEIQEVVDAVPELARQRWPEVKPSGKFYRRSDSAEDALHERSFLAELVAQLPAAADSTPGVNEYLALLDRVLEDRRVSDTEFELLLTHAEAVGLLREQVLHAHRSYMDALIRIAMRDGRISETERDDLEQVRRLLCIPEGEVSMMFEAASTNHGQPDATSAHPFESLARKSVCFTGELQCAYKGEPIERDQAEDFARSHGMIVKSGVSKALDYLVVADPDTMSGKAKKAREYGTRIIAEPLFWQMLGIDVD